MTRERQLSQYERVYTQVEVCHTAVYKMTLKRFDQPIHSSGESVLFGIIMSQSSPQPRPFCSHHHGADDGYRDRETASGGAGHASRSPWNAFSPATARGPNSLNAVTRGSTMTASHSRIPRGVLASTLSEVLDIANEVDCFMLD
jgi:hypothetical protein